MGYGVWTKGTRFYQKRLESLIVTFKKICENL